MLQCKHNIIFNDLWDLLLWSLSGFRPVLLANFSSSVAWPPWCSSLSSNKHNHPHWSLNRFCEHKMLLKKWTAETSGFLTCPLKSFCATGFCFTLQVFLSMKLNNIIIKANQIILLCVCTHVGRCNDEQKEQKAVEKESLTARPHWFALNVCVVSLHALLNVLNYADEEAD